MCSQLARFAAANAGGAWTAWTAAAATGRRQAPGSAPAAGAILLDVCAMGSSSGSLCRCKPIRQATHALRGSAVKRRRAHRPLPMLWRGRASLRAGCRRAIALCNIAPYGSRTHQSTAPFRPASPRLQGSDKRPAGHRCSACCSPKSPALSCSPRRSCDVEPGQARRRPGRRSTGRNGCVTAAPPAIVSSLFACAGPCTARISMPRSTRPASHDSPQDRGPRC